MSQERQARVHHDRLHEVVDSAKSLADSYLDAARRPLEQWCRLQFDRRTLKKRAKCSAACPNERPRVPKVRTPYDESGDSPALPGLPLDSLMLTARRWIDADPDPETRSELESLISNGNALELRDRFDGSLRFGTAGIRAALGAGPLRMNRLVAARFATGLGDFIHASEPLAAKSGVVIGFDGRTKSRTFAYDIGRILSRGEIPVFLFPEVVPTPVLAFAVRRLSVGFGVMVTASHNPKGDNGIKLYVADGGQLLPPVDEKIASCIDSVDPLRLSPGWDHGMGDWQVPEQIVDAYVDEIVVRVRRRLRPTLRPASRVVAVHTALHGVSAKTIHSVMYKAEYPEPVEVAQQAEPDPDFPTTPFPNPEEAGSLDLAARLAEREGADLVIANDPDGDRLAVMIPGVDGWRALTGDELGNLLAAHLLQGPDHNLHNGCARTRRPVVSTTVVSSSLLRRMAEAAGLYCVTTLTGFKWITRAAGPDGDLVYGYEEALGYAVCPDIVVDKDGISAALAVVEIANKLAAQGRCIQDSLDDIALDYGLHTTKQRSLRVSGQSGMMRLTRALDGIRMDPPAELSGLPVTASDMLKGDPGVVDLAGGTAERSPGMPHGPADLIIWRLGDQARLVIRPSGTEPKIKIYAEVASSVAVRSSLRLMQKQANEQVNLLLDNAVSLLQRRSEEEL